MNSLLGSRLNYQPLIAALIEKTKEGKIDWRETVQEESFIAAVRGRMTFEIRRADDRCELAAKGEDGRTLFRYAEPYSRQPTHWEVDSQEPEVEQVTSSLGWLHDLAGRLAKHLDENLHRSIDLVRSL